MAAAGRALAMGKPILAIKTGSHAEVARRLAVAHRRHRRRLRRLSRHVRALRHRQLPLARRHGRDRAWRFEGGRLPKGPRIGFVTTSGGTVDLLYDYVEAEGAAMPEFTDATKATLRPLMQDGIAPKNPLDVGIPLDDLPIAAKLC